MTCRKCNHIAKKFGIYGKRKVQRYRCVSCRLTFSAPRPRLGTHYIDPEVAAKALSMMLEGMSIRAISRVTGLHKNTVLSLMLTAAENARRVMESRASGIRSQYIECDEVWCFIGKKSRKIRKTDPAEFGDQWVFVALDAETKLVPCFEIGKRIRETTVRFLTALRKRLAEGRFQLTTDGFHFYERGVEDVFGGTVDFVQLTVAPGQAPN